MSGKMSSAIRGPTDGDPCSPMPVLVQNPDGSISQGVPPGYKEKRIQRSPRVGFTTNGLLWGELEPEAVGEELMFLHARHERLFHALLTAQLVVEICFCLVWIQNRVKTLAELDLVYGVNKIPPTLFVFWLAFTTNALLDIVYFMIAASCLESKKPSRYRIFAIVSILTMIAQVLLIYINKFNTLIFFLRLLCHIHAKFLSTLAQNMTLQGDPDLEEEWF